VTDVPRETPDAAGDHVSRETAGTDARRRIFAQRLPVAERYAQLLATDGVVRGLIGPRETDRIWDRHLLNCAVMAELIAPGARVCDVGSGAGLPGIPLAIARPDLQVELVDPLLRRTTFLQEVVAELGLGNVTVTRARAEELAGTQRADMVTARAVAAIPKLAAWCLPLLRSDGSLLALKGARASAELADAIGELRRLGARHWDVVQCGIQVLTEPTTVVRVVMGAGEPAATVRAQRRDKRKP
jgi:16S rRNA (guanine527-N7)-methyltransferase